MCVEGDTLLVVAAGRDESLDEVMAYGKSVVDRAAAEGCTRILCDERRLEYALETFDTYEYGQFLAKYAPKVGRTAIVCDPAQLGAGAFWEDVVVNRGLHVRMFVDVDAARAWLDKGIS